MAGGIISKMGRDARMARCIRLNLSPYPRKSPHQRKEDRAIRARTRSIERSKGR